MYKAAANALKMCSSLKVEIFFEILKNNEIADSITGI